MIEMVHMLTFCFINLNTIMFSYFVCYKQRHIQATIRYKPNEQSEKGQTNNVHFPTTTKNRKEIVKLDWKWQRKENVTWSFQLYYKKKKNEPSASAQYCNHKKASDMS